MADLSPDHAGTLTSIEAEQLIKLFATYRGLEGFTEEEMVQMLNGFNLMRVSEILLDLVLRERVSFDLKDGEIIYDLTPEMQTKVDGNRDYQLSALLDGTLELEGDTFQERDDNEDS
jgi:hypothetical protein